VTPSEPFASILDLATTLQRGDASVSMWKEFERTMGQAFGHKLFTVLAYDSKRQLMRRLYSNREDVSPTGGAKAVTDSPWTRKVLRDGQFHMGATREDIKVFSEYERLWAIGCESTFNIPVRKDGVTVGTINLLDAAHRYDQTSEAAAMVFAQFAADTLAGFLTNAPDIAGDASTLEHV